MAQQPSSTPPPASSHYLTQAGLTVALTRALASLWPSLDLHDLRGSLPGYQQRVTALVRQFALASASLSAREYAQQRVASGIRSRFTVPLAEPPGVDQVDKGLHWALEPLWDSAVLADPDAAVEQVETAQHNVEGKVTKLVLDAGRQTVIDAVSQDRQARAWARETQPGCCYWCAMLATRGAVYRSAESAGQDREFHDHDKCVVVPVFGAYELTAHARQWRADYYALKDQLGHTPSLLQWRQHFEGRPVDGLARQDPQRVPENVPQ